MNFVHTKRFKKNLSLPTPSDVCILLYNLVKQG